jgi:hypothetical protein
MRVNKSILKLIVALVAPGHSSFKAHYCDYWPYVIKENIFRDIKNWRKHITTSDLFGKSRLWKWQIHETWPLVLDLENPFPLGILPLLSREWTAAPNTPSSGRPRPDSGEGMGITAQRQTKSKHKVGQQVRTWMSCRKITMCFGSSKFRYLMVYVHSWYNLLRDGDGSHLAR